MKHFARSFFAVSDTYQKVGLRGWGLGGVVWTEQQLKNLSGAVKSGCFSRGLSLQGLSPHLRTRQVCTHGSSIPLQLTHMAT